QIEVVVTTLDQLIERFGMPAFIKLDVEGSEPAVLAGLSRAIRTLSFEYLPRAVTNVERSLARLTTLGDYRFNWSAGESFRLRRETWMTDRELLDALASPEGQRRSGDVYARQP